MVPASDYGRYVPVMICVFGVFWLDLVLEQTEHEQWVD